MGHGIGTTSEHKLWLGNLDAAVTEYQLLSLVQKYGEIHHFDYVFHRSGPHAGLPRGFAYVTFKSREDAQRCLNHLNGVKLKAKNVWVKWAKEVDLMTHESYNPTNRLKALPAFSVPHQQQEQSAALGHTTTAEAKNRLKAIAAIEAKLKQMEKNQDASINIIQLSKPNLDQLPTVKSTSGTSKFRSKATEAYRKHQRLRFNDRARLKSRR